MEAGGWPPPPGKTLDEGDRFQGKLGRAVGCREKQGDESQRACDKNHCPAAGATQYSALIFAPRAIFVNTATSSRIRLSKPSGVVGCGFKPIGAQRA